MSAASSGSNAFSESTRLETKALAGLNCWACNTTQPQICPVVAKEDPQRDIWEEAGLFTFSYESAENAIPLCASCHVEFDLAIDPGYVFFPTDLKFFIDFEMEDRERRRIAAENGHPIRRQVPTAVQYRTHQQENGMISSDAICGLYRRVFLKNILHGGIFPDLVRSFATSKEWHGNPMASIRRAIAALGSSRFYVVVDPEIRSDLERLRNLYFGDETQNPESAHLRDIYKLDAQLDNKRHLEDQDDSGRAAKKMKDQETEHNINIVEGMGSTNQCLWDPDWVLGPDSTSNKVMQRYGPLFSSV
ncbi:hypothetical protein BO71DRAFT_316258 [Aspergillus ellipticus CBS 707.79]|uniref:HNH nuclease domain-containing protein n=1 Tax=Aspergillus ellipticus CBS 707.79 TaxID=1448320 RepID=A0A319DPC1_9EURO|nr:hypothetical protein BO71DRAFT_316258 [Aspergillus ellipticus CBS 707.79]